MRPNPALLGKIRNERFWEGKTVSGPRRPVMNDPGDLARMAQQVELRTLPEERVEEAERERTVGPKPEPPKSVPRPLGDNREIVVGSLMDRQTAATLIADFHPGPWETATFWLNPDNMNEIQPDKLALLFGKRRTGKSYAARWLLHTGRALFNSGMVLTNTAFNHYWQSYFPEAYVHEFDPVILDILLHEQQQEMDSWIRAGRPRSHNPYKILVLDDVVGQNFRYVDQINKFATQGRHFGICVILMTQYPKMVNKAVKTNCDFAFIFFQQTGTEKEAISEEFFSNVPADSAMAMIEEYTEVNLNSQQRELLVLDQMTPSRDLNKKVFLCEPNDPGDFVVGSPDFWKNDPRYERLLRKGAFGAWEAYRNSRMAPDESNQVVFK
jgi:hypothetical protein